VERFWTMLKGFLTFDLGKSFFTMAMSGPGQIQVAGLHQHRAVDLLLSYLISVPLGIAKAVREGSRFDTATTGLVLVGYSIPGFVLGVFLLVLFAGGSFVQWFPLRGLTSDNWASL
jgi:microcin C transport system permease protein